MTEIRHVQLIAIKADRDAQPRVAMDADTVRSYVEQMLDGDQFPPIVVFFDGTDYWLGDGFHRYDAANGIFKTGNGPAEILCEVHPGGLREAILHSVGANAAHGLKRTNEDKRRAVLTLLNNPLVNVDPKTGASWSDADIARRAKVSPHTVAGLRPPDTMQTHSTNRTFIHPKTGRPSVMDTSRIGKPGGGGGASPASAPTPAEPAEPASPAETVGPYITHDTRFFHDLGEMLTRSLNHPDPVAAIRDFPPQFRYVYTSEQLNAFADWADAVANEWARTEGAFNVAAE